MKVQERDREFWSQTWLEAMNSGPPGPDSPTWNNERERRRMDFLRPYLPNGGRAVEIGCGSARLLARVGRQAPFELMGVDYSIPALQLVGVTSRLFGVTIHPFAADAMRLPFPDRSVDLVLSGGLMEHFEDPRPALAEMVRILKPGGTLYADIVPRRLFSLHRPLHRWRGPDVHRTSFGVRHYRRWLSELGLTNLTAQNCGVYLPSMHRLPPAVRQPMERLMRRFDGTSIADALGYNILVAGTRAE